MGHQQDACVEMLRHDDGEICTTAYDQRGGETSHIHGAGRGQKQCACVSCATIGSQPQAVVTSRSHTPIYIFKSCPHCHLAPDEAGAGENLNSSAAPLAICVSCLNSQPMLTTALSVTAVTSAIAGSALARISPGIASENRDPTDVAAHQGLCVWTGQQPDWAHRKCSVDFPPPSRKSGSRTLNPALDQ